VKECVSKVDIFKSKLKEEIERLQRTSDKEQDLQIGLENVKAELSVVSS
jgi:hypothetical protein